MDSSIPHGNPPNPPWSKLWADVASVELVFDEEDNCAIDAEAALMSVRDDDLLLEALETHQQNAKFAMSIGATYADDDDDWLFESIGEVIAEGEATIAAYRFFCGCGFCC